MLTRHTLPGWRVLDLTPIDLTTVPYIPCRDQYARTKPWTWVCYHEAQTPDLFLARRIAEILQDPVYPDGQPRTAGIHDSVGPTDVACSAFVETMTVPHCYTPSGWSWGIEHVGRTDDIDPAPDVIRMSARLVVARLVPWEERHGPMPLRHLTPQEIVNREQGFGSHWDATQATWLIDGRRRSGVDHTDGRSWPWADQFDAIADVRRAKTKDRDEEDDVIQFPIRALTDGPLAGRWVKVRPEDGGAKLRLWYGSWLDVPAHAVSSGLGTSVLDVAKALGKPALVGDVSVGQAGSTILVSDGDGDYAFSVA